MRLLPRSLFGRLSLLLVVALVVVQIAAFTLLLFDRGHTLALHLGQQWARNVAGVVRLVDVTDPGLRPGVMRQLASADTRIDLLTRPTAEDMDQEPGPGRAALHLLRRELPGHRVAIQWERDEMRPRPTDRPGMFRGHRPPHRMTAQVELSDGQWLQLTQRMPAFWSDRPFRLLINLSLLVLAAVLISWWVVRRVTRPLQDLAQAANRLGADINQPPLSESGPREVAEAARSFNRMQRQIRSHLEERTRILAAVSHDLKTPITRMRLRAELLDDPELRDRQIRDLEEMSQMVEATLELMRGVAQASAGPPTELGPVIQDLVEGYAETGQQVTIHGRIPSPLRLRAETLRRCLDNLLGNALRYAKEVELQLDETAERAIFRVCDRGPGIAEAEMERVFEPFYRLEPSRNREAGGTGLGLSIARSLARAHGGDIELNNRSGGGLCAELWFPRHRG